MNKADGKFCPDCGHHLYGPHLLGYFCIECEQWIEPENVITLEQAQPLRVGYDASAKAAQDE